MLLRYGCKGKQRVAMRTQSEYVLNLIGIRTTNLLENVKRAIRFSPDICGADDSHDINTSMKI